LYIFLNKRENLDVSQKSEHTTLTAMYRRKAQDTFPGPWQLVAKVSMGHVSDVPYL